MAEGSLEVYVDGWNPWRINRCRKMSFIITSPLLFRHFITGMYCVLQDNVSSLSNLLGTEKKLQTYTLKTPPLMLELHKIKNPKTRYYLKKWKSLVTKWFFYLWTIKELYNIIFEKKRKMLKISFFLIICKMFVWNLWQHTARWQKNRKMISQFAIINKIRNRKDLVSFVWYQICFRN